MPADASSAVGAYFDYNATAPLRPEVVEQMNLVARDFVGNPSSMHAFGRRARALIDESRHRVAALVEAEPREVVFTSGATEANNLAIGGFVAAARDAAGGARVITSAIEHASVVSAARAAAAAGAQVEILPVDADGMVDLAALGAASSAGLCLVSLGLANGETGHLCPLERVRPALGAQALLHLDAAQALGRVPVSMQSGARLLSLATHKFGGPRGVGALVVSQSVRPYIAALMHGGPQESGLRAGTENLAGIVGMGVAAECAARDRDDEALRLKALRERLWGRLAPSVEGLLRLTPLSGLPNTLTVALPQLAADSVIAGLDLAGFAVSSGSACAAASPEPSHVIAALGVEEQYRAGVIRMSMGHATTPGEVDRLADAFVQVVTRAREAA